MPNPEESALGFCLRVARANGVSLPLLFKHFGLAFPLIPHIEHAQAIASFCGCDVEQLRRVLPNHIRGGRFRRVYFGHEFSHRSLLRLGSPQICPICIRQHGYARSNWDLTYSTVCIEHRCGLADMCPQCVKPIRWNRPALEWGHCKHHLTRPPKTHQHIEELLQMQQVTDALFEHQPVPDECWASPLAGGVSLNGWFNLIFAFGMIAKPGQVARSRQYTAIPRVCDAGEVVERAHNKMMRFLLSKPSQRRSLESEVQDTPLIAMIKAPFEDGDRAVACAAYADIFGVQALQAILQRFPTALQLSLFDENL